MNASQTNGMTIQLHFAWVSVNSCFVCSRQRSKPRRPKRIRNQQSAIFTISTAAAKERLMARFLTNPTGPLDLLEEEGIISDLAIYMGYLFEMGYRDYDSNYRKLMEELRAALSKHLDQIKLKRERQQERKFAVMMAIPSSSPQNPN